ncbi:hypothetical protein OAR00_00300 [Alphaproteobacteria bacterium]|nr:hypothetical protein [Alphaproteobacteria bacterium]
MKETLLILLLSFGLSSCVTTEDIKSVSKKVSNNVSVKEIKEEVKNDGKEFIQWKCFKYDKHILNIGYFPLLDEVIPNVDSNVGMLHLLDTDKVVPVYYTLMGVKHTFTWGNFKKDVDTTFQINIDSDGTGRFWDFTGAEKNEKVNSSQTYYCTPPETILIENEFINELVDLETETKTLKLTQNEYDKIKNHLGNCWEKELKDKKEIDESTIISIKISTTPDGVVSKTKIMDEDTYNSNKDYKMIADSAKSAVLKCSPLPIPKNKSELFKDFIMDFDYKFTLDKQ